MAQVTPNELQVVLNNNQYLITSIYCDCECNSLIVQRLIFHRRLNTLSLTRRFVAVNFFTSTK